MVEQQQDTGSDSIQVRNHSKNLSTKIHTLSPPPPPSPQIVMDSDGGRMHMKSNDSPDASWGVLIAISEKAKSRPQVHCQTFCSSFASLFLFIYFPICSLSFCFFCLFNAFLFSFIQSFYFLIFSPLIH